MTVLNGRLVPMMILDKLTSRLLLRGCISAINFERVHDRYSRTFDITKSMKMSKALHDCMCCLERKTLLTGAEGDFADLFESICKSRLKDGHVG
jgi:hypothetical protein